MELPLAMQLIQTENDSSTSSDNSTFTNSNESLTSIGTSIFTEQEEENDPLLFPLFRYIMTGQKRQRVQNYIDLIDSWPEAIFKENMRIDRSTATLLLDQLEMSDYIPSHPFGVQTISAKLSLYIFLWYIANTEPLRTMSDRFNVSISSVFRILRRVTAWFLTKLDEIIAWPRDADNIRMTCEKFRAKQGIPNILGAIDSTHIRIVKPSNNSRDYFNQKKNFSINLQAVVDADKRFTNIYIGEPGSLHDARVLRRSPLHDMCDRYTRTLFPHQTFLRGDSAYSSLPWLVPPFRDNGHLTPEQHNFNYIHSSTRVLVEQAFGLLKGRFRRLKFFTEYRDMPFMINLVIAGCILHNLCINNNDLYNFPGYVDEGVNANIDLVDEINNENNVPNNRLDRRMQLFNEIFPLQ